MITPAMKEAQAQAALLDYVANKRWEKETGGITVSGFAIATDAQSQTKILGARVAADSDSSFTTEWKSPDGTFTTIDAPTIIAISNAVLSHVQSCFALESQIINDIENGIITTKEQVDSSFQ